ncbi:MAG: slipin family protein [Phormidesmis sp.]
MRITIFEYERGLKYVKGRFQQVLPPGQYRAGWFSNIHIRKVDIRPQYVSVPGQAILTQDGVGLKVSLTAVYEVSDPAVAINRVSDYRQALYLILQNGLREIVGATTLDTLLETQSALNQQLLTNCTTTVTSLGLRLIGVSVKDIMLPGDLKRLYAQVIQARQEGKAQLERARGESAALRSLANAARLAEDNPKLLQLRLLQALENSSGHTISVGISSEDQANQL